MKTFTPGLVHIPVTPFNSDQSVDFDTYAKFPNGVLTGTYDTGFHTRLMAKDVRLFNEVAGEIGTLHEVSEAVGAVWNACEDAMPASDFSEIWKYVSRQSRG